MVNGPTAPVGSVVAELQLDPEVVLPQQAHGFLQVVLRRRADTHLVALDRGLHFLQLLSFRNLTISRAASIGMPCWRLIVRRTVPAAARSISPALKFLTGTFSPDEARLQDFPERLDLHLSSAVSVRVLSAD